MENEKENAEIFRQLQSDVAAEKARDEKLRTIESALSNLKSLLELREKITRDLGSGYRAANELDGENLKRREAAAERQQFSSVNQLIRYRQSVEAQDLADEDKEEELVGRLIQVEKARELAETAVTSFRTTRPASSSVDNRVISVLETLDERKPRQARIRKLSKVKARSVERRSKSPIVSKPPSSNFPKHAKLPLKPSPKIFTGNEGDHKLADLSVVRRSIDSMRRSWEIDMDDFRTNIHQESEEPHVIRRESRNAAIVLERKRAALASLKLRPKPSSR